MVNPPLNNINGSLVNVDNSQYSANAFSSSTNPSTVNPNVMPQPASNVQAAASYIPCAKGGMKIRRHKINKISRMYKMKSRRLRKTKSRLRSKYAKRTRAHKRSHKRTAKRSQRGGMPNYPAGYSQYQNNMPMSQTYSLGGKLTAGDSALANPPPVKVLENTGSCTDNYNHYTNQGFPSRGWW
jgi:hypothetical protein